MDKKNRSHITLGRDDNKVKLQLINPDGDHQRFTIIEPWKPAKHVGDLIIENGEFILKIVYTRQRDLHKTHRAYRINDAMVTKCLNTGRIKTILMIDEFGRYRIPINLIIAHGKYYDINQTGYKRDIFIALKKIEPFMEKPTQGSIF